MEALPICLRSLRSKWTIRKARFDSSNEVAQDLAKCDNRTVQVTSRYNVLKAARRHPDSVTPVMRWLTVITAAECGSLADVRKFYPSADQVGKTLIFNVDGNNYRLLCCVSWEMRRLFFRALLTHAEYDRVNAEALCP